jgi:site-specific recombinase XerD
MAENRRSWCGRRDLNPGRRRGRLLNYPECKLEQFDGRIENKENNWLRTVDLEAFLKSFSDFCLVDLQLSRDTVKQHRYNLRKFFNWLQRNGYGTVNSEILREFLMEFRFGNPYTYSNIVKSLKRFFRDFLGIQGIVKSFRFPSASFTIKKLPTKEELKKFYEALNNVRDKTIFLLIASSGLRRNEALNLKLSSLKRVKDG